MTRRTVARLVAAAVVSVGAYVLMGAAGLWGVALAAPVLVLAPSAVRDAVAERRTKQALNAELSRILGRTSGRR